MLLIKKKIGSRKGRIRIKINRVQEQDIILQGERETDSVLREMLLLNAMWGSLPRRIPQAILPNREPIAQSNKA